MIIKTAIITIVEINGRLDLKKMCRDLPMFGPRPEGNENH